MSCVQFTACQLAPWLLQVVQARREVKAQVATLEKLVAKQMRQFPVLKPYAKQPYLSYITWTALALPLLIISLPFLLFTGGRMRFKLLAQQKLAPSLMISWLTI